MARNHEKNADAPVETSCYVSLIVAYVLVGKSAWSLAGSTVIHEHAMEVLQAMRKYQRGTAIVPSTLSVRDDGNAIGEFKIYSAQRAQADLDPTQTAEFVRKFVDTLELSTACVAVGDQAARLVAEGVATAPRMREAHKPQSTLAVLDEDHNVVVVKSPHPHVKRFKRLLAAAGKITSMGIEAQFELQGKVTKLSAIPPDAMKAHRYADSTITEVVLVTGYLRRGRIVELELYGKNIQLEVPEDYSAIVAQAAKSDAMMRVTLEVYKCTNPCLPDAPLPKIVSVDEILGQEKLRLVV